MWTGKIVICLKAVARNLSDKTDKKTKNSLRLDSSPTEIRNGNVTTHVRRLTPSKKIVLYLNDVTYSVT